ncbi:Nuclear pore complex protein NUP98A [Bienertia sinuspersici]
MFGTTSTGSHNPFVSTTSRGSFGGLSSSGFGKAPERAFGSSAAVGPINNKSNDAVAFKPFNSMPTSQTTWSSFRQTNSNALGTMPLHLFSSSSSAASPSLSTGSLQSICGPNTGSRISSYRHTIVEGFESSGCKLMSISAMPFYESKSHEELRWEDYELKSGGMQKFILPVLESSPLTAPPISAGYNEGVSIDIGQTQPSPLQQIFTIAGVKESIVAVKDPFGSERTNSLPSIGLSACSFVQHGISSMPVPFFQRVEEIHNTSKAYSYNIIPRENPRAVFAAASEESELMDVSNSKEEAAPLSHESAEEYEHGKSCTDSFKKDRNDHFAEANDNSKEEQFMPKLQRSDYYTDPEIKKLASIESLNPGFCCRVEEFVVGRVGYGWVKFYGETDIRGLDLDSIIHFNNQEVIVYDDDNEKPPVGQGLNKAAEVTLLNIKCNNKKTGKQYISGKMVDDFIEKLKRVTKKQGAEFVSYDPVKGEWKFSVQHF